MNSKTKLHPRNPHHGRYDFQRLCGSLAKLNNFVIKTTTGEDSIDFSNPMAVRALNEAILAHDYGVTYWPIPEGFLCPPIPGRADYIHYIADLLAGEKQSSSKEKRTQSIPKGADVKVLDIGIGANCIYPIIGSQSYGWSFVGTEVNPLAIQSARLIVEKNSNLTPLIKVIQQKDEQSIFRGIIRPQDHYHVSLCNPPFHRSAEEARSGSQRKWTNLSKSKGAQREPLQQPVLNFGGQSAELWCQGGELSFLKRMATESRQFAHQVGYFTSLVSKSEHVRPLKKRLQELDATVIKVIEMTQGHKTSRILVWSYKELSKNN